MAKKASHGANLFDLSQKYNFKIEEIKDYSSNINPFGISEKALNYAQKHLADVRMYPDPEYFALKSSIALYCKSDVEDIILGEGATGLIQDFISCISPRRAMIVMPSYSEYESRIVRENDCEVIHYVLKKENLFQGDIRKMLRSAKEERVDFIVLCNPNNPTGSVFSCGEIEFLSQNFSGNILLDETYMEFADMEKFSSAALIKKHQNIFLIRGTSKFFSTPGLRLGYALSSNPVVKEYFERNTDLWNINIIASMMGEIMFRDEEHISFVYRSIVSERERVGEALSRFQELRVYPSHSNFILCEIVSERIDASFLYEKLIEDALVIRNCSSFQYLSKYFFRICILLPQENTILIQKLSAVLH